MTSQLSELSLLKDHDTLDAKQIARDYFGGATVRFVHQQREARRFPCPSFTTPGLRGRHVWLRETVDAWLAEYLARSELLRESLRENQKTADRALANDAAFTAARIAEAHDEKLRQAIINQRRVRSTLTRESNDDGRERNGRDISSASMVVT